MTTNGPMISWRSKKQQIVALSSCEAESISLARVAQEAIFLRQLYADMVCTNKPVVNIFVDNQGAIMLAKNPVNHQRSKHIDIKYYYIRSQIETGNLC